MRIEDQVCSLELSKKLKTLGVKQESAFYWMPHYRWSFGGKLTEKDILNWSVQYADYCEEEPKLISAFTVAELGEMLPSGFYWKERKAQLGLEISTYGKPKKYRVQYRHLTSNDCSKDFPLNAHSENSWADSLAKMLICLREKGLLNPGGSE